MPYPNEHAARIRDPGLFIPSSFRSKNLKGGVRLILGKLKLGGDSMVTQAYRFSVDDFTPEEARRWLKDNKVSFIKFEPAKEESMNDKNELQHVGILGMRWGVRKGPPKPGGREDRRWDRKVYSGKTYVKVYNATADRINSKLPSFNAKYKNVNLHNKKNFDKYISDYKKLMTKIANEELAKTGLKTSPSGYQSAKVIMNTKTGWIAIVPSEVNDLGHADDFEETDDLELGFQTIFDDDGFITRIEFVDNSLVEHSDSLQHVGVLGMRWGVRRGDNASGGGRRIFGKKKRQPGHPEHEEVSALRKKKIRDMSNQEMEKVAKRLELEKRYKNINPSRARRGQKAVGNTLSALGKAVAFAGTVTALAATGKKVMDFANAHRAPAPINPLTDFLKVGG